MQKNIPSGIMKTIMALCLILLSGQNLQSQSVARQLNEVLLEAIRDDYARPTVHARNLFHTSAAMFDCWAAFVDTDDPYFLGNTVNGFHCPFDSIPYSGNIQDAQEEAMSYAVYRLLYHRFRNSPGIAQTYFNLDQIMLDLGYDIAIVDTNYTTGSPAALGNYVGQSLIRYGQQDGANEQNDYENIYYEPLNDPMIMANSGNPTISHPNNWQPLTLDIFIDQSGDTLPINTPPFLSPEWGNVLPFSLKEEDKDIFVRDGNVYQVYHDPGLPPLVDSTGMNDDYKWNFALVPVWGSHLDTTDGVMMDCSPASIGNNPSFPTTQEEYRTFYDFFEGGDQSTGRTVNPSTGLPYVTQMIPRADYARVLAEFWADGPDSETPPGHWYTIINTMNDHPDMIKKYRGTGEVRSDLEWEVKMYLVLGGTMHDVAITAWGIKGYYDYIRPVSAVRWMAAQGQCSDTSGPSYSVLGIPLYPGYIEVVEAGDPLEGAGQENIGKIKLNSWRGPDYILDEEVDEAGVGWILAADWWPYQRPSFVTPPFAGYVSGHSTYSRAAAEALTMFTGDEYFPGGYAEFIAPANEFLVFEDGPSMEVRLQWATYRDASDQCSLSRIWGGIHPPADDIPGRVMGIEIGTDAFIKADSYWDVLQTPVIEYNVENLEIFPSPLRRGSQFTVQLPSINGQLSLMLFNAAGQLQLQDKVSGESVRISTEELSRGVHFIRLTDDDGVVYGGRVTLY